MRSPMTADLDTHPPPGPRFEATIASPVCSALMSRKDWGSTSLGPFATWPQSLRARYLARSTPRPAQVGAANVRSIVARCSMNERTTGTVRRSARHASIMVSIGVAGTSGR